MQDSEIAELILQRLYAGAFSPGVDETLNLHEYATEVGVDNQRIWEIFERLKEKGLVEPYAMGGWVVITTHGILHCEQHGVAAQEIAEHQGRVRTELLDAAARFREQCGTNAMVPYTQLCSDAGVEEQDFRNNMKLLSDCYLLEPVAVGTFRITPHGMEAVEGYRKRRDRLDKFVRLSRLDGVTPQQRGHDLEDLIGEAAEDESWEAQKRVRAQGTENDLILHAGLHYFLVSCKWEKDRVEAEQVELLESRVRARATTNGGLLVSMSGFTDNCIEEARLKINSAQILLFGPADIESVFSCNARLTQLLEAKLQEAMHHRKILVDGKAN